MDVAPELLSQIERIFIHEESVESELASRVRNVFPIDKIEMVTEKPFSNLKGELTAMQFERSKRMLYIAPFKGHFFKRCPGATQKKVLNCCNYYVLNLGLQCNMNCSYCYLQSYINTPVMTLYSNLDQALTELREMAELHRDHPFRVGTGEVIDSLSMDDLTHFSRHLIEFFRDYPKWTLEFKTKSDKVDQFLDLSHAGNVVVSWSINPAFIINSEEHGTARFEQRIAAAKKCRDRGFKVAFHIDPLIYHPDWQKNYGELVDTITANFKPQDLHIISLGALRFQSEQRHMMRERFGLRSLVTSAEMHMSDGGKMRYDWKLRNEMFQFVIQRFKAHNSAWNTFLCMETPESWISSYDSAPMKVDGLKEMFRPLPKIKSDLTTTNA